MCLLRLEANTKQRCLIEAARRCQVEVVRPCTLGDHDHAVIFDRWGRDPALLEHGHRAG